jgi:hypothetical protein
MRNIQDSQPGWVVRNSQTEVFVTERGGHMAPATFAMDTAKPIQPYYISPWQNENLTDFPDPVLVPLRGDFFCLPFGGNNEALNGEKHTCHGEAASGQWHLVGEERKGAVTSLTLDIETRIRPGRITHQMILADGHPAVYSSHRLEGYDGPVPLGHHATLALPDEEGGLRVSVGKFDLGLTNPMIFSRPENREYQSLAINRQFTDLRRVPTIWTDPAETDCSSFPRRQGFTDLLLTLKKPTPAPAWTAAYNKTAGYLWFALKDAALLPGTAFWIANGGRHGSPWNGRNRCLGLEDICGYFAEGLVPSVQPNDLSRAGFPTAVTLSPERPTVVNYIQGAIPVPADFGETVADVAFAKDGVIFRSDRGNQARANVAWNFLAQGAAALA